MVVPWSTPVIFFTVICMRWTVSWKSHYIKQSWPFMVLYRRWQKFDSPTYGEAVFTTYVKRHRCLCLKRLFRQGGRWQTHLKRPELRSVRRRSGFRQASDIRQADLIRQYVICQICKRTPLALFKTPLPSSRTLKKRCKNSWNTERTSDNQVSDMISSAVFVILKYICVLLLSVFVYCYIISPS
jgi:hypothetical protein